MDELCRWLMNLRAESGRWIMFLCNLWHHPRLLPVECVHHSKTSRFNWCQLQLSTIESPNTCAHFRHEGHNNTVCGRGWPGGEFCFSENWGSNATHFARKHVTACTTLPTWRGKSQLNFRWSSESTHEKRFAVNIVSTMDVMKRCNSIFAIHLFPTDGGIGFYFFGSWCLTWSWTCNGPYAKFLFFTVGPETLNFVPSGPMFFFAERDVSNSMWRMNFANNHWLLVSKAADVQGFTINCNSTLNRSRWNGSTSWRYPK